MVNGKKQLQTAPVFLPWEPHEQYEKVEKKRHQKMSPLGWKVSNMLLRKSRGQLLIISERMKQLGQRRNDPQLWICLVVKVKSAVLRIILHRNLEC